MRNAIIAGNWKMNLDRSACRELAAEVAAGGTQEGVEVVVCPPAVYLSAVLESVAGSSVLVGAQNVHSEPSGAFTGEISAPMLADVGCHYSIVGHSERRTLFGETDTIVNQKVQALLAAGLRPIVCVGESLEQREAGETEGVIRRQFDHSLEGLDEHSFSRLVIAYEPVWAIGTGKVATPGQAEEVHADLRKMIANRYNSKLAEEMSILYGGSVKPDNAADLLSQPNIDGALVGGASLKAASFLQIIDAA